MVSLPSFFSLITVNLHYIDLSLDIYAEDMSLNANKSAIKSEKSKLFKKKSSVLFYKV